MSKFARIINVKEVAIEASDDAGDETVTATITAVTFFFLESEVPTTQGQDYGELLRQ